MTLEQLRIFVEVAERQHLTRGAAALNLSPSAVSTAIRTLEDRHGVKLFSRVGRQIELTDTGRRFLPDARAALAAAAAAELSLTESTSLTVGTLTLQASQTVAAYWLPPVLMRFRAAYPGVSLTLDIGNTESVARHLREGGADLGFIEGEVDEPLLAMRVVAADRLALLTAPGHKWTNQPPTAGMLAEGHWILRERGSGTRSAFEASLRADGVDPEALDVVLTLPSNEAILSALGAGAYVGVASERVAAAALAAGRLARLDYLLRPRPFRMLWHKSRYLTRAARAFEALLPREL
jgi:DNA-binding transcriptional LysR family regulator